MSKLAFLLLLGLIIVPVFSENPKDGSECENAKNCKACMGASPECSWCFDESYDDTRNEKGPGFRCALESVLNERGCPADKIQSAPSSETRPPQTTPGRQITPNEFFLKIRPQDSLTRMVEFVSRKNYPVDLYFLVDLSYTMRVHLETVSRMTNNIKQAMLEITDNLQIGFGAFCDKPVSPFILPERQNTPCEGSMKCEPTFLYRHMLSLTTNFTAFEEITSNMLPSANLDNPEGGFDALLQVAHCGERIGWRKDARRIVVFATDGSFHLAGDGRLAGLIKPAPTTCQLLPRDPNNIHDQIKTPFWYWNGLETDYPSIGEISRVLTESSISVIFATLSNLTYIYKAAASFLPSASAGVMNEDSRNIVQLLTENYNKIASKVELVHAADPLKVDVMIKTKCHDELEFTEKRLCENHPVGGKIQYQITVTPKNCFNGTSPVKLHVLGLEEHTTIYVTPQCDCPLCEQMMQLTPLTVSPKCNMQGTFECGACTCQESYSGDFCKCSKSKNEQDLLEQCRKPGTSLTCSKHGRCVCGECVCSSARYSGRYCECDREMCPRSSDNNQICGGPSRGSCGCDGNCTCKPGYTQAACDCLISDDACRDKSNPAIPLCYGKDHGTCDCGSCFCSNGWTGRLCNERQGDGSVTCDMKGVKECIPCLSAHHLATEKGLENLPNEVPLADKAKAKCKDVCEDTDFDYMTAKVVASKDDQNDGSNLCIHYTDKCKIFYFYRFSDVIEMNRLMSLKLVREPECPNTKGIIFIVAGVVAAIVLGGLLFLLIYKLVITIEDTKEHAKFESANKNSQWAMTMNPTYTNPSTTVQNPMYQK